MPHRSPADPDRDPELLPESAVAPLLARASELDATRAARLEVSALRAAATEAGISEGAFDAALAELRGAELAQPPRVTARPRAPTRSWAFAAMVAALVLVGPLVVSRLLPAGTPLAVAPPMVEEALLLQCLSPAEAAELIQPLFRDRSGSIVISPEHAPRVITIRATPTQIRDVKALLQQYESPGSAACATGRA